VRAATTSEAAIDLLIVVHADAIANSLPVYGNVDGLIDMPA